ncbi:hypothetical protein BCY91_06760 [Pelobium manganitolerans]|uniref:Uncharacterized protein n=1 Tax=Pelobium manganitolerans TaxID=1842495 RepID=A0A419S525_9SPHI|nr:hypothetical protein [Pelobium manganitolerans]RKD15208.1 hypothetical protein BCY91_06760 [Pelobium manganitolerans]
MKVSEKSNGAVQPAEDRREESIQAASQSVKPLTNGQQEKSKVEEKPSDIQNLEVKPELKAGTQKPQEAEQPKKLALNLEATLKLVDDLHRRSIQRDNLLNRIHQLDAFEITLIEEGDELESNHFQGCQLIISDDKGRKFITQTAGLIKLVAEFIHRACLEKLGEIESNIVFPQS